MGIFWKYVRGFSQTIDGTEHFLISPALADFFVPHREEVFERYLDDVACTDCDWLGFATDEPPALVAVPLATDERSGLDRVSEKVRALDAELKVGLSDETLGGARTVH